MSISDNVHEQKLMCLQKTMTNCRKCRDLVITRNLVVIGYGDLKATAFFIGEAPGRLGADKTGVPFTKDRSGKLLQRMLVMIGMNENDETSERPTLNNAYVTNLVRCNPLNSNGTNRSPTRNEISNCKEYLLNEIQLINPKILIPLGVNASKFFFGDKFKDYTFGRLIRHGNRYIFPLWHPAFVIRGGGRTRITEEKYAKYFVRLKKLVEVVSKST